MMKCKATLMIKGEAFPCEAMEGMAEGSKSHEGWPHSNKAAQAIWGENDRGTEENPIYAKSQHIDQTTSLWMVTVDEGWRSTIVASGMYEYVADWLVEQLQGKPFPVR
jgi:hypothetical protein